jgi:trans-2,3-dihydro-3-hydroxyanthranilate isomerase
MAGPVGFAQTSRTSQPRNLDFVQVDVFTTRALEGNPLMVFPKADGVSDETMLAIARELNHSETAFIQASRGKGDAVVRIFSTSAEMPFAGHPTLGTAFVLAQLHPGKTLLQLEEKVGVIPVKVEKNDRGVYFEMTQNDPTFGPKYTDRDALARSLMMPAEEFDSRYTPQVVSTGNPFLIVSLRARSSLERLSAEGHLSAEDRARLGTGSVYYIVTGGNEIEARLLGRSEDPATGSAAGCATSFLVQYGHQKPDTQFMIHQGRFVNRPSMIYAAAALTEGRVHNVRVGGYVVEVMRGSMLL